MNKRPNILWLTSDQQRWDTIHASGNDYIDTPNLDKLCKEGVLFTQAYCQSPICTPSRASFLSGRYPSAVNANINGGANLPEHCQLVSKKLADSGYLCGLIGKLHITSAWDDHEDRMDDGFSYFCYNLGPGHDLEGQSSQYAKWLREEKNMDWRSLFTNDGKHSYYWYKEDAPVELRQTAWCAEKAIDFISKQDKDKPWMLCVNCYDPHPPFDAPASNVQKYLARGLPDPIFSEHDIEEWERLNRFFHQSTAKPTDDGVRRQRASYYGMCELVDMHFGRIIEALDHLGLRDDTIIIFNSDHGEMLGDHGLTHKGCRFYEGLVHVPLIISCPSRFASGVRYDGITELTDLSPTIAQLCGIEMESSCGHSLLDALQRRVVSHRSFVRTEYYHVLDESLKFGSSNEGSDENPAVDTSHASYAEMYYDGRFKLCVYHGSEYGQLFDMKEDPSEKRNLWDDPDHAGVKMQLLLKSYEVAARCSRPGQQRRGRY